MPFGIPEWALGVGVIIIAVSIAKSVAFAIAPGRHEERQRLRGGRKASLRELTQTIDEMRGKVGGAEALQQRLDELEDVQRRLAEVEERLDFAERLLTKQRDVERLPSERK